MNKITFQIQFKRTLKKEGLEFKNDDSWNCWIANEHEFKELCVDKYVNSDILGFTLECSGKLLSGAKTQSQLGYLHAEVLKKALIGYQTFGWNINNTEQAKYLLKEQIGFHEEIEHPESDIKELRQKSFAEATREETRLFIDQAIIFIEQELRMKVESPENYKKRMGIKEFTK